MSPGCLQFAAETQLHVLTYATHCEGTYKDLVDDVGNNNLELTVIGWGEKWKGYMSKLRHMVEKLQHLPATDVVIVVDAFDVRMNKNYSKEYILNIYNAEFGGAGVVFSKDKKSPGPFVPRFVSDYVKYKIFGSANNANAGMYIGRVMDLLPIMREAFEKTNVCGQDDQCAFNKLLGPYNARIDNENKLFKNIDHCDRQSISEHNVAFCGFPFQFTFSRLSRVPFEYFPFFVWEIITLLVVFCAVLLALARLVSF